MSSVIRPRSEPSNGLRLPRFKTMVGVVIVAIGLWLSVIVVRELLAVVSDPNASAWLETFSDLPAEARTITTPDGEYRLPPVILQSVGLVLLALFLYCLTSLAVIILRIGGWMLRDDAEEVLKKFSERVESMKDRTESVDLLTQGLLGAAVAQGACTRSEARSATAIGLLAGALPDADALIRSPSDPLLFLDFHRHFTHALVVVPVIGLAAACLAWPLLRGRMAFPRIYLYAFLGAAFAGVLDACTSYGTRLLWPFSDQAVAWSIVSIVDPVVTVALAIGLVMGFRAPHRRPALVALLVVSAYLGLAALQYQRARTITEALARGRDHVAERIIVKPTIANVLLWRSLYVANGRVHADAVWLPPFAAARIYDGESAPLLAPGSAIADHPSLAPLKGEIARFARFADGLLVLHPQRAAMLGDARFSMLPTSLRPLWGIEPAAPGAGYPAEFVTDRSMTAEQRQRFVDMLLGKDTR